MLVKPLVSGNYISVVLMLKPILQVSKLRKAKDDLAEKSYHLIHY